METSKEYYDKVMSDYRSRDAEEYGGAAGRTAGAAAGLRERGRERHRIGQ